jgi:hypothetical protein
VDAIESGIVKIPRVPVDTVSKTEWEGEGDPPGKNSSQQTACGEPLAGRLEQKWTRNNSCSQSSRPKTGQTPFACSGKGQVKTNSTFL